MRWSPYPVAPKSAVSLIGMETFIYVQSQRWILLDSREWFLKLEQERAGEQEIELCDACVFFLFQLFLFHKTTECTGLTALVPGPLVCANYSLTPEGHLQSSCQKAMELCFTQTRIHSAPHVPLCHNSNLCLNESGMCRVCLGENWKPDGICE